MNNLIIIGGGGHAKVIAGILKKLKTYTVKGYTDIHDRGKILGVPYLGTDAWLIDRLDEWKDCSLVIGLGMLSLHSIRKEVIDRFTKYNFNFPVIVSPNAVVSEDTEMEKGTVVIDGAVINPDTKIDAWGIVNTNATVDHDCTIGSHVHIAPGAVVCGGVSIGSETIIGAGAVVKQNISICNRSVVGAGAVVVSDIREPGIYTGCPAKLMEPA